MLTPAATPARTERPGQHGNRGRGGPTGNQTNLATAAALANRSRPAADGTLPHGRYKLPVLKTAPPLPGTKTWVAQVGPGRAAALHKTKGPLIHLYQIHEESRCLCC
jgi:hypothetical protein